MFYYNGSYHFKDYPHRKLCVYGDDGKKVFYCTDGFKEKTSKLYYKHPYGYGCKNYGYYFIARFPDGGRKKIWFNDLPGYYK